MLLASNAAYCQDGQVTSAPSGLARISVGSMPSAFGDMLSAEILRRRVPVQIVPTGRPADCVMAFLPDDPQAKAMPPGHASTLSQAVVMIDVHSRLVVWEKNLGFKDVSSLKTHQERELAVRVVKSISHDGAFCGGSPFDAPTQNMEDRMKAFKPPFFNW